MNQKEYVLVDMLERCVVSTQDPRVSISNVLRALGEKRIKYGVSDVEAREYTEMIDFIEAIVKINE